MNKNIFIFAYRAVVQFANYILLKRHKQKHEKRIRYTDQIYIVSINQRNPFLRVGKD